MIAPMLSSYDKKLMSWASVGLFIFIFAFLWAPSRDGLQIVYLFSFFLPILAIFFLHRPKINEYINTSTILALIYGAFSACAALWGDAKSFGFFLLQWVVLATWLCGTSIVFSNTIKVNIERFIFWFVILGCIVIISTIIYHYILSNNSKYNFRLMGWNAFRNPNEIGAMCGIIALLAIINAFQSLFVKRAIFYYFLALIAFAGLILSFSRAAMLALFITSLLALIVIRPPAKIWLAPTLILLFVAAWIIWSNNISGYYFEGRGSGFSDRFDIWADVIKKSFDNIFIGIGMSEKTDIIISNGATYNHAHNAWIDTYYRTGIVGLLLIVLHLISTVSIGLANKKILPLLLWLCFGCVCSLFDGRVFFGEIGAKWFLYWLPAGLIVACAKLSDTSLQ